jgi:hypothetical protein
MTNHILILSAFFFLGTSLFGQKSDTIANELFKQTYNGSKDTIFLFAEQYRIIPSSLANDSLNKILESKYLNEFRKVLESDTFYRKWTDGEIEGAVIVPDKDSIKSIGRLYMKSQANIDNKYWYKYGFDSLSSYEMRYELEKELRTKGIISENFETVPRYYRYILLISKPVISRDQNFALLQVSNISSAGYLESHHTIYLFQKINGKWEQIFRNYLGGS